MELGILNQADIWADKEGVTHQIEQMSGRYALSVYNFLLSKAQTIGIKYGIVLASKSLPDEGTAAFSIVAASIDREHERIAQDCRGWIMDKPLMRALMARVELGRITREQAGYVPPTEPLPLNFKPYVAEPFDVKPQGFDLDEERFGQRPGDETKVFLANRADYESVEVEAVFVGNRLAAYQYAGERERYGEDCTIEITEWDDHADDSGVFGMYAQIRKYHEPWTEITYRTSVNLETGEVDDDARAQIRVRNDIRPDTRTEKEADGGRGRLNAVISTHGPDTAIEQLRHLHAANVNHIRANVLDDLTKDQP